MDKKLAIVTGASKGVGKGVALHLASIGYIVVLIARNAEMLKLVCDEILVSGGQAVSYPLDVSDSQAVQDCVNQVSTEYKRIDLLFNNAAILKRGTTDILDEDVEKLIDINLKGAIYVAKHVATHMKKQQNGYIINVFSSGGKVAVSFAGGYAASKFGLCGFSEALAKEMSVYGVKVTTICPSMIATDMASGRQLRVDQMIQIEDIIKTVDYLLSLSKSAVPLEITISCLPFIAKMTDVMQKAYLS